MRPMHLSGQLQIALFALGLLLRIPGLFMNGTGDIVPWVFNWGGDVLERGLAAGFNGKDAYGLLSYALAAPATLAALEIPRFWFLPHKAIELAFEIMTLLVLRRLVPLEARGWPVVAYWLNPWFIVHSAYHGYWDPVYVFFGLLAAAGAGRVRSDTGAWIFVGLCLTMAAFTKPQGFYYFIVPVTMWVLIQYVAEEKKAGFWFLATAGLAFVASANIQAAAGGEIGSIARAFNVPFDYMPALSANSINIWYSISVVLQEITSQTGHPLYLKLDPDLHRALSTSATVLVVALLALMAYCSTGGRSGGYDGVEHRMRRLSLFVGTAAGACGALFYLLKGARTNRLLGLFDGFVPDYLDLMIALFCIMVGGIVCYRLFGWLVRHLVEFADHRARALASGASARTPLVGSHTILALLAFTSLVVSQLGTRAHENHTYAALVLMVPLVIAHRTAFWGWFGMTAIHFYLQITSRGLGLALVKPTYGDLLENPTGRSLVQAFARLFPAGEADTILTFQRAAGEFLEIFRPTYSGWALLCVLQAALALWAMLFLLRTGYQGARAR